MMKILFAVVSLLVFHSAAIAAPPIEAYGHLPSIEMMQLSPSGKRYAFVAVVGESRKLAVLTDHGEVVYANGIGELKARALQWVGEDHLLLRTSATFDHRLNFTRDFEFSTVINIDLKTGRATNVFDGTQQVAKVVIGDAGTALINGHSYGYFVALAYVWSKGAAASPGESSYTFQGDHRNLYRVDLDSGDVTLLAHGGEGPGFDWVVGTDGNVIAHSEHDTKTGMWRLYAGDDRKKLLMEKVSDFGNIKLSGLGRKPNTVLISDGSSGNGIIEEISVPDGNREKLFSGVSVDKYLRDPDSGLTIGASSENDPGAVFFDPQWQARIKGTRKAFPGFRMQLFSYARNMDRLIVETDAGDDSGTYWLVDITTGKADPIGYPYPEIRPADVGPTQWITYKAADGLEIPAVLTLPPGRKPEKLPLVVLPHGGPIGVRDVVGFDWWAQAYASIGYAVLQPNYRGSSGSGADFKQAGFGQWGRKMQTDLSDGVAALASQGIVDPKRVCIVGGSYGGYAALAGVTLQQGIYRCAVSVAGVSDLPAFFNWRRDSGDGRTIDQSDATRYWRAVTGADKEGDDTMRTLSPAYFADRASSPILLVHGRDDVVVPISQSNLMAAALRRANKPVEFIEMKGEDHWLSRDETRKTMLKASLAFVKQHNPPN